MEKVSHSKTENNSEPVKTGNPTGSSTADKNSGSGTDASALITEDERNLASLGYFGFLFILPLLKRDSEFCQWHARQAMVLNLFIFVSTLFLLIIPSTVVLLGALFGLIRFFLFIFFLIVMYYGYLTAKKGGKWKIPYIYDYVAKLPNL